MSGPIIICDKSTIQGLNRDEAFWLGTHYRMNLVPIFFTEVLADLSKRLPEGRSAEHMVATIAEKTSGIRALPNVFHGTLVLGDLLGHAVKMNRVPVIPTGKVVETADGKKGMFFEQPPETIAMQRWASGDFFGIEREYAAAWRQALEGLDLKAAATAVCGDEAPKFRDLGQVKLAAERIAEGRGCRMRTLKTALQVLSVPSPYRDRIIDRWKILGGPRLGEFAPYADYVFRVEIFFHLGMAARKIATTRPSHRTDIAYLFYLPFCEVFSSCDRFHAQSVPYFLRSDQVFIDGQELKTDLASLVRHYEGLPELIREKGAMAYAPYPPVDANYLTSRLYDRFRPGWRKHAANPIQITPELSDRIARQLKPLLDAIEAGKGRAPVSPEEGEQNEVHSFELRRRQGRWKRF